MGSDGQSRFPHFAFANKTWIRRDQATSPKAHAVEQFRSGGFASCGAHSATVLCDGIKRLRRRRRALHTRARALVALHLRVLLSGYVLHPDVPGPVGSVALLGNRHLQKRESREGDYFTLLIESNGPGCYYTELGRTCVLDKASQEMQDEAELVRAARRFTIERLHPGTIGPALWEAYKPFWAGMAPLERRLHCYDYDMVERPLMRHDEAMVLSAVTSLHAIRRMRPRRPTTGSATTTSSTSRAIQSG